MSDINSVLENAKISMDKAINHLETELQKVRAGKASPAMLESIMVDYYGSMVPLSNTCPPFGRIIPPLGSTKVPFGRSVAPFGRRLAPFRSA